MRKDGTLVDVQMMLVPLEVDGEHVGFYAIYHDITELQRAREHAETLLAVTQVLGKTLSLDDTFETILERAAAGRALRQLFRPGDPGRPPGDRERARLRRPGGLIGVGFDLDDETNPGIQVVRSKRRQVFADVSNHPHFASQRTAVDASGAGSVSR